MKKKYQYKISLNVDADYSWDFAKKILQKNHLSIREFNKWMYGQTCPIIEDEYGRQLCGIYGYDLNRYLRWKLKEIIPIWD